MSRADVLGPGFRPTDDLEQGREPRQGTGSRQSAVLEKHPRVQQSAEREKVGSDAGDAGGDQDNGDGTGSDDR